MIARHWRGQTHIQDADRYENFLQAKVFPSLRAIKGYCGGYILRNDGPSQSEFVVINLFESLDAVRRFAGPEYMVAVIEPEARQLLCSFEPVATHYEIRFNTAGVKS